MHLDNYGVLAPLLLSLCFAPIAIGADSSVISHCATNEDIFFSCQVRKKIVSVCAVRNMGVIERLSYRYGALGKIENEYTASEHNQNRFFGNVEPVGPRAIINETWFVSGNVKYLLTACTGGNCPHTAGLTVFRGDRILSNSRCVQDSKSQPWFSSNVVEFSSEFDKSRSKTNLLILTEVNNSLEKIYSLEMLDGP